jgi:hypothetical protein
MGISDDSADQVMMNCCLYDLTAAALTSSFKPSSCTVGSASRGCCYTAALEDTGRMAVLVDPTIGGGAAAAGLENVDATCCSTPPRDCTQY